MYPVNLRNIEIREEVTANEKSRKCESRKAKDKGQRSPGKDSHFVGNFSWISGIKHLFHQHLSVFKKYLGTQSYVL